MSDWSSYVCSSDLRGPAGLDHAAGRDAAAEEDGIGRLQAVERRRRFAGNDLQGRRAEALGVVGDHGATLGLALDGEGAGTRRRAHPFDGDRARSEERRVGKEWVSTCRSWW